MNSLIILPTECVAASCAILTGDRAVYAYATHEIRSGEVVKVAVLGGLRGEGRVIESSLQRVQLELNLRDQPLPVRPWDLVVGVSRPQTIKKVIQAAVMLGVRSLHFVRSERGEKSYLKSHALTPESIHDETIKALEQIWDSRAPQIRVHRSFDYFCTHTLSALGGDASGLRIVAHPEGHTLGRERFHPEIAGGVVAIGPERGWDDGEVDRFRTEGFTVVGLGERVVRVEVALTFLMGQLEVLLPRHT